VRNIKLFNSIKAMEIHYPEWIIENAERLATETYKLKIRKGRKGHREFDTVKLRCYQLAPLTDIHPTETIVSVIKKVEKEFELFPKILATELIDDWMVIISEWGEGIALDRLPGNLKMKALKSYGKFLRRMENLGFYPRDGKWDNVVYNDRLNFAYLCDFGRFEIYVEGGNERLKKSAMNYKEDFFKRCPGSAMEAAFYEGYNKKN